MSHHGKQFLYNMVIIYQNVQPRLNMAMPCLDAEQALTSINVDVDALLTKSLLLLKTKHFQVQFQGCLLVTVP